MNEEKYQETLSRLPIIILHLILAAIVCLVLVILRGRGYLDGNITEIWGWGFFALIWTVSLVYSLYATAKQKDS
jgi:hypothetical protein